MFKSLAFQSWRSVPNKINFILSWSKCTLNLLSTNQSHKLEKSFIAAFQFQLYFPATKLCKHYLHKVTNRMTTLEASHLYKEKAEVFLKWILGERRILGSMGWSNWC